MEGGVLGYFCGHCHAARDEETAAADAGGHHAEFAGGDKVPKVLDFLLELGLALVGGFVGVGGLVAGHIGVAEAGRHPG